MHRNISTELSGPLIIKTHINTEKIIEISNLVSFLSNEIIVRCIDEASVTFNTHIIRMATACIIPSIVTAIPYGRFFPSASTIVPHEKQYRTTSWSKVGILPCRFRSSETQLATSNPTLSLIPVITTDSTPAKTRIIYFDCSSVVF